MRGRGSGGEFGGVGGGKDDRRKVFFSSFISAIISSRLEGAAMMGPLLYSEEQRQGWDWFGERVRKSSIAITPLPQLRDSFKHPSMIEAMIMRGVVLRCFRRFDRSFNFVLTENRCELKEGE